MNRIKIKLKNQAIFLIKYSTSYNLKITLKNKKDDLDKIYMEINTNEVIMETLDDIVNVASICSKRNISMKALVNRNRIEYEDSP